MKLRVARVVMDFGQTTFQFNKDIASGKMEWDDRIKIIFPRHFRSRSEYQKRIKKLFEICKEQKCEIAIFPASAFLWKKKKDIRFYREACEGIPWVVTGDLKVGTMKERIAVLKNGRNFILESDQPSSLISFDAGKINVLAAISSDIRHIFSKPFKKVHAEFLNKRKPLLATVLGHQQPQSSRYKTHLEKILREVYELSKKEKVVILPYWQSTGSKATYDFYEPNPSCRIKFKREKHRVQVENSNDFVDIITIKL